MAFIHGSEKNLLRLITGGPGSGKSSFARVFASETILRATHRVLFIELQHMGQMTGDLEADIACYFKRRYNQKQGCGTAGFPENPLDWIKSDDTPVLFVFDGLDELSFDDARAVEINRKLIQHIGQFLSRLNTDGTASKALILGRNQSVQLGMKEAGLARHTMLNVAPIKEISQEELKIFEVRDGAIASHRIQYPEINNLSPGLIKDQRPIYWNNWMRGTGQQGKEVPEAIIAPSLSGLNEEPLLLHLLILSDFCGERWTEAVDNRNCVYEDILTKIHQRNTNKVNPTKWSKIQFFHLMEALGLSAWRGNQRAGTESAFNAVRDVHAKHLFKGDGTPGSTDLKNVILLTHARSIDGEDAGFEFIHKSFGEYLAARGLITASERWHKKFKDDDGPDQSEIALKWAELVTDAELTPEIIKFLYSEARLRSKDTSRIKTKETLEKILQWVTGQGVPVHKLSGDRSFKQLENCNRCSVATLLACASAWACTSDSPDYRIRTNWPSSDAIRALEHLHATHSGVNRLILARLDLSGADLTEVNLCDADLNGVNLCDADLNGADLSDANLRDANLSRAHLIEANLSRAHLIRANLSDADLSGANLSEADLRDANLSDEDLSDANLNGADLSGANLSRADLSEADLRDANLSRADLSDANLSEADLSDANLSRADLSDANLSEADLRGADLRGADLRDADLNGADLSGADLSGAKIKTADLTRCIFAATRVRSVDFTSTNGLDTNVVQSQFGVRTGFGKTLLPVLITYPSHWHAAKEAEKDSSELRKAFQAAFEEWQRTIK